MQSMPTDLTLHGLDPAHESPKFFQGMLDRLKIGKLRYGGWQDNKDRIDFVLCAKDRIKKYQQTGNTEFLIDAANFLMGEFIEPGELDAHFTPTDESHGVITRTGNRVRHADDVRE